MLLSAAASLTLVFAGCSSQSASAASPTPNPAFANLIPTLKQKTQVPILLPTHIPPNFDTAGSIFANIFDVGSTSYNVIIVPVQQCTSQSCEFGFISGQTIDRNTPALKGTVETLGNGTKAYYNKFTCHAACGDSTLDWNLGSDRYTAGIKIGKLTDLLAMANSFQQF